MINIHIDFGSSGRRYFLPRTGYTLFGSFYFLFTFQFMMFLKYVFVEIFWFWVVGFISLALDDPSIVMLGFFLPRLWVPFTMHHNEALNDLEGAWRIDWVMPWLLWVYVVWTVLEVVWLRR